MQRGMLQQHAEKCTGIEDTELAELNHAGDNSNNSLEAERRLLEARNNKIVEQVSFVLMCNTIVRLLVFGSF